MADTNRNAQDEARPDRSEPATPPGSPPPAGPHANPALINPDATPGTGALPPAEQQGDIDSTSS